MPLVEDQDIATRAYELYFCLQSALYRQVFNLKVRKGQRVCASIVLFTLLQGFQKFPLHSLPPSSQNLTSSSVPKCEGNIVGLRSGLILK